MRGGPQTHTRARVWRERGSAKGPDEQKISSERAAEREGEQLRHNNNREVVLSELTEKEREKDGNSAPGTEHNHMADYSLFQSDILN